uniref:F-box domain-containing protein n=1 Tax=Kalanchoe fedtschenkoi TaxID=63787 RepID=A0A7N0ZWV0_KALFE
MANNIVTVNGARNSGPNGATIVILSPVCVESCVDKRLLKVKILMCNDPKAKFYSYNLIGAAGLIALSDNKSSNNFQLPGLALSSPAFEQLVNYYTNNDKTVKDDLTPVVAHFSSRGPNTLFPEIMKSIGMINVREDCESVMMDSAVAGDPRGSEQQLCPDLIREILVKLPVKALVRFKQVSKTWMRIIKSNRFASEHYRYSAAKNRSGEADGASFYVTRSKWTCVQENKRALFISNVSVKRGGHECRIHETVPMPRYSKYNQVFTYRRVFPAGFGLYCVSNSSLARPSSHAARLANSLSMMAPRRTEPPAPVRHMYDELHIYSSSTGSWRLTTAYGSVFPQPHYAPWHGVNLRDAVHILAVNDDDDRHITTFDYEREEFGRMGVPRWHRAHLTSFDDRFLCLVLPWFVNDEEEDDEANDKVFLDVWIMREYGVEGSWSKERTTGPVLNRTAYVKDYSESVGGIFLESWEQSP